MDEEAARGSGWQRVQPSRDSTGEALSSEEVFVRPGKPKSIKARYRKTMSGDFAEEIRNSKRMFKGKLSLGQLREKSRKDLTVLQEKKRSQGDEGTLAYTSSSSESLDDGSDEGSSGGNRPRNSSQGSVPEDEGRRRSRKKTRDAKDLLEVDSKMDVSQFLSVAAELERNLSPREAACASNSDSALASRDPLPKQTIDCTIVVTGNRGTGKKSLLSLLYDLGSSDGTGNCLSRIETLRVRVANPNSASRDVSTRVLQCDNGMEQCKKDCLDITSNRRVCMVMYDCTQGHALKTVEERLEAEARRSEPIVLSENECGGTAVAAWEEIFLVATKVDLVQGSATTLSTVVNNGYELAQKYDVAFFCCTTKLPGTVAFLFQRALGLVYGRQNCLIGFNVMDAPMQPFCEQDFEVCEHRGPDGEMPWVSRRGIVSGEFLYEFPSSTCSQCVRVRPLSGLDIQQLIGGTVVLKNPDERGSDICVRGLHSCQEFLDAVKEGSTLENQLVSGFEALSSLHPSSVPPKKGKGSYRSTVKTAPMSVSTSRRIGSSESGKLRESIQEACRPQALAVMCEKRNCADCTSEDVSFVSHQFAVPLCRTCAYVHEVALGPQVSEVHCIAQSHELPQWGDLWWDAFRHSALSQNLWDSKNEDDRAKPGDGIPKREEYIVRKYKNRLFYESPILIGLFRSAGEKKFEKRTLKISADEVTIHVNRDNSLVLDLPVASTQIFEAESLVPGATSGGSGTYELKRGDMTYVVKPLDGKEGQRFFSALRIACVRAMCKSNLTKHDKSNWAGSKFNAEEVRDVTLHDVTFIPSDASVREAEDTVEDALGTLRPITAELRPPGKSVQNSMEDIGSLLAKRQKLANFDTTLAMEYALKKDIEQRLKEVIFKLTSLLNDKASLLSEIKQLEASICAGSPSTSTPTINVGHLKQSYLCTKDGIVRGATPLNLIVKLTTEDYADPDYLPTFLATYPTFTRAVDMLAVLGTKCQPPAQRGVRLKVYNVVKHWVSNYWIDFRKDPSLVMELVQVVDTLESTGDMGPHVNSLRRLLTKKIQSGDDVMSYSCLVNNEPGGGSSRITSLANLVNIDPTVIATQLTLRQHELLCAISPRELLKNAWAGSKKWTLARNVMALTEEFNTLPMWVISVVLKEEQQKARTRLVEHFVTIAMKCRELNNFHAILGILGGLKHTSVKRLTKTWQGVANRINTQLQDLSSLMSIDDNWGNFRKALTNCGLPAMPYIGVLLKDLLFLEDGISDFIEGEEAVEAAVDGQHVVNFSKRRQVARLIQEIQKYQESRYSVADDFVAPLGDLVAAEAILTEEESFALSLQIEPRPPPNTPKSKPM